MKIAYCDNQFLPFEKAFIPISDRGFLCGDGAYATIQVRDGVPLFINTHLEQLKVQCSTFNLAMPSIELELIEELIERNSAKHGIWRLKIIVTGGDATEMHLPKRAGRLVLFLSPFQLPPVRPLVLELFPTPFFLCHASFKSLAHLNRYYVMEAARNLEIDDCVTVTEKGLILETAFGNLFWVKEKNLYTPDPALPLYFGVTIKNSIKIAEELNFTIEYVHMKASEIPDKAVCFRTNTMHGIRSISRIGEREFSSNKTVETLFTEGYEDLILNEKKRRPLDAVYSII